MSQFAQYLLRLDPQRNPARLTLFNYLKHVCEPQLAFTPEVVQGFYGRVLQFDQWRQDAQLLSETVRGDLLNFLKQHVLEGQIEMWRALRHPDTMQIVNMQLFEDFSELAQLEHESRRRSGDQIKSIKLSDTETLVLILSPSGCLEAKVFANLAVIWGPRLRLVTPITHLYYSSELELMPHLRQTLQGSLLTTHVFQVDADGVHGLVTRGHTFQKFETFIRAKLSETQDLFSSLKRVERHFINPQTDPFYQELIGRMERAIRLLNQPSMDNLAEAERVLNRGRSLLRSVFVNDRLLTLLVTHLEYGISQHRKESISVANGLEK